MGLSSEADIEHFKNFAIFSYLGHAGRLTESPYCAFLEQPTNALYSQCGNGYTGACKQGLCLDKTCKGQDRDEKCSSSTAKKLWLDKQLLAVLAACNTASDGRPGDPPSMAQILVDHGVDCVIGFNHIIYLPLLNFWYYHFNEYAYRENVTIEKAAQDAYESALRDIIYFWKDLNDSLDPVKDFNKIIDIFPNKNAVFTYNQAITIIDKENVSGKSILPARFGAMNPCPEK